jgi:hypothetical protein
MPAGHLLVLAVAGYNAEVLVLTLERRGLVEGPANH